MNSFIEAQIRSMLLYTKQFENACRLAAVKDDGAVSKEEQKLLAAIHRAVARFSKDLEHLS
ncbi:MAG: hypothetical protein IJU18_03620 [Oscillospiraceae bacterium]|nr:hypothetical protein [Oscillospiraceae bacterium]